MKKIDKLNINFEKNKLPERVKLEALHDKINQCVRAINLMHGHYEPGDLPIQCSVDLETERENIKMEREFIENKQDEIRTLLCGTKEEPNVFYFEQINLAVLESGRYHVEKHRLQLLEIKIGYKLHDEFLKFTSSFQCQYIKGKDFNDIKFCNAKITFALCDNPYYMNDNEILFLSEVDNIYARGIKKGV